MSRSFKKNPIVKYAPKRGKIGKQFANRKVRRTEEVPSGKQYKKIYCSWEIHDICDRCTLNEFIQKWSNRIQWCENNDKDINEWNFWGITIQDAIKKWKKFYIRK